MKGVVHSREVYKDANCVENLAAESGVLGEMCSSLFVVVTSYPICVCVRVCVYVCTCMCVCALIDPGRGVGVI